MALDRTPGDFGRKLRDARERRGLSLRQIANATKISVSVLEALERNDISRLPGGIFSRAFVRSYATEVGLDPETAIQEFLAQFPNDSVIVGHSVTDPVEDYEAVESERRTASTFLRLVIISVPMAIAVLYFSMAGRPSPRDAAAPAPRPAEALRPTDERPAAPGAAADRLADASRPSISPAAPAADHLTVGIAVSRPCWISATVDGEKKIERLLQPGDDQMIEVTREIVLTTGDADALTMTLNGAPSKPLGKPGEVVTRRVNLANFKEYLQTP